MRLVDVLPVEYIDLNNERIKMVKNLVDNTEPLTWVLGSGISVPFGLPTWNDLLTRMWMNMSQIELPEADRPGLKAYSEARKNLLGRIADKSKYRKEYAGTLSTKAKKTFQDVNPLEAAEYMYNYIDDIIEGTPVEDRGKMAQNVLRTFIRKAISVEDDKLSKYKSTALDSIAEMIARYKHANVITYNYDTLLEYCLEQNKAADNVIVRHCDDHDRGSDGKEIEINHPHGLIRVRPTSLTTDSDIIILTESSYYGLEQKVYSWANSVQAKALNETRCIFVGFSGDDRNFRRIIHNTEAGANNIRHFFILCVDTLVMQVFPDLKESFKSIDDAKAPGNDEKAIREKKNEAAKLTVHEEGNIFEYIQLISRLYAQQSYWAKHGIYTIWTTFDELKDTINAFSS